MGDTDPERKVSKGIGHLRSWAGFMAAQLWAINFAKKCELHQYAADNNESICCPKCSFKLITLLNFGTKCEGKFVPDSPTNNVATECTAAAGLGWWENRISSRLCQPIRGKP